MKLSEWAKKQGIAYVTAWRWFKKGKLPVKAYKTPTGTILVEQKPEISNLDTVVYCRVSSYEKKDDLLRQGKRCEDFCVANGWSITKSIREIGSGMNDSRKKLTKLLESSEPIRLVVEHKDRLTRFGFNFFDVILPRLGWEIVVINRDAEEKDDLLKDLVAIITSFCCRLYGLRRGKRKAREIKQKCVEQSKSL